MGVRLDRRDVVIDWDRFRGCWVEVAARIVHADPDQRFRQEGISREAWAQLVSRGYQ